MVTKVDSKKSRLKRRARVRGKVYGTAQRPRLAGFRSANPIYAQVINDDLGVTLAAASSMDKGFDGYGGNKEGARKHRRGCVRPRRLCLSRPRGRTG